MALANVKNNKKAIAECSWFPCNKALLLYLDIRVAITQEDLNAEIELG